MEHRRNIPVSIRETRWLLAGIYLLRLFNLVPDMQYLPDAASRLRDLAGDVSDEELESLVKRLLES